MKFQGWCTLIVALLLSSNCLGDEIIESFSVGSPFFSGTGDPSGDQSSTVNEFDSSPITGFVHARDAESILAGGGDVRFTANTSGQLSRIDFDMGLDLATSSLPDAVLTDSKIMFGGIEADADADDFTLDFNARFLDGTLVETTTDLNIIVTNAIYSLKNLDAGLFELSLELTGASPAEIEISSGSAGDFIRSVTFRNIQPDVAGNIFTVSGEREITFTAIPEPASILVLGLLGGGLALRRRRSS